MRQSTRLLVLVPAIAIAFAAPMLGQKVTVDSADPSSTIQGTTLNVTIRGKGFSPGAVSKFLVTGTSGNGRVTVNSTAYINSSTLVANITAADDAVISLYDIAVTSNGRTGKGIEKFSVQKKQQDEAINPIVLELPEECTARDAHVDYTWRLNNGRDLASLRFPASIAWCGGRLFQWAGTRWEQLDFPAGMTGGNGSDVSEDGTVVGWSWCFTENGERCAPSAGFFKRPGQPSQSLPETGFPSSWGDAANISSDGRIIVGGGSEGALVWTWDELSSEWVNEVLGPGHADSISDDGNVIVGNVQPPSGGQYARAWIRSRAGEPYEPIDLSVGRGFASDVSPSGSTIVGVRWAQACANRRCTQKTDREVPVFWRRDTAGEWVMRDLPLLQLSSGEVSGCGAWGVSDVVGKGAVIVGRCVVTAVAWLPDANGSYGAPILLPNSQWAITTAINQYGWILGRAGTLDGERAILWKLP